MDVEVQDDAWQRQDLAALQYSEQRQQRAGESRSWTRRYLMLSIVRCHKEGPKIPKWNKKIIICLTLYSECLSLTLSGCDKWPSGSTNWFTVAAIMGQLGGEEGRAFNNFTLRCFYLLHLTRQQKPRNDWRGCERTAYPALKNWFSPTAANYSWKSVETRNYERFYHWECDLLSPI